MVAVDGNKMSEVRGAFARHSAVLRSLPRGFPKLMYGAVFFFLLCFFASTRLLYWPEPTPFVQQQQATALERTNDVDLSIIDADFVSWPLARVCREATWTPGVVFMCDNNSGGIGNIRNYILTCLRYAIHSGASGVILPQIETRSSQNLSKLFAGYEPMEYFFDTNHFRHSLNLACPQITIYDTLDDVPNLSIKRPHKITPKLFAERTECDYRDLNRHTDLFFERFNAWLEQSARDFNRSAVSAKHPRLIQFTWGVQWEIPVFRDGPEFFNTFGGLLKFRHDILEMGHNITTAIRRAAEPHQQGGSGVFSAIHLRSENDALDFWPTFETQAGGYIDKLIQRNLTTAYLATGNQTEGDRLVAQAVSANKNIQVLSKNQLLAGQPGLLKKLNDMTWDQQALVDYVVLVNSDYFLGVSPSSFSMTIAAKRHLFEDGIYTRPWKIGGDDGRSYLVGNYTKYWNDWLFMYDALWP